MVAWPGAIQAVTLFVEDLAGAKEFYRDAFELPVHFENENSAVFRFGGTMVNLLEVASAPELVAPAPVASPEHGVRAQWDSLQLDAQL